MKICSKCNKQKSLTEFDQKRGQPQSRCKECRAEYMKAFYLANIDRERATRKLNYQKNKLIISIKGKAQRKENPEKYNFGRRLKKYGITKEQYLQVLEAQNNSCAICKEPFTETPAIDHCHTTLQFRGLLCDNHNTGIGLFQDNIATLEASIAYLKKYKK